MFFRIRILPCFLAVGLAALLAGCLHDRFSWAPDGTRASIITADGLYVCGSDGRPGPLLAPGVYRAAWLADSRRLAVAMKREIGTWEELESALGPERSRRLAVTADGFLRRWELQAPGTEPPAGLAVGEAGAVALYLKARDGERLRRVAGSHWAEIAELKAEWHTLAVVRPEERDAAVVAVLRGGLAEIVAIRPAPQGRAVALVYREELSSGAAETLRLQVVADDGSSPPVTVVAASSAGPDWSADGRTLLAFAGQPGTGDGSEYRLGVLAAYDVVDADGRILADVRGRDLAAVAFHDASRVRVQRDGRAIFNAPELRLPAAAGDDDLVEALFQVDQAGGSIVPLIRSSDAPGLPKALSHFEPGPDGRQLLVGAEDGRVWLVTPAEKRFEAVCGGFGKEDSVAPAWRAPGEFTYRRPGAGRHDLVHRSGREETVLSRDWPADMLVRIVK